MIALQKLPEPQILIDNRGQWENVISEKRANGLEPSAYDLSRYNHPEIKLVLIAETSGKCAYCECKMLHVAFGDVEHITPKSNDEADRFRWSNLTLACGVCNNKKRAHANILDPYSENPDDVIGFLGDVIYARELGGRAERTVAILGLNRPEVRERRYERIDHIEKLLLLHAKENDPDIAAVIRDEIVSIELADDKECVGTLRHYVRARAPEVLA